MGRSRKGMSAFAGLTAEVKQALCAAPSILPLSPKTAIVPAPAGSSGSGNSDSDSDSDSDSNSGSGSGSESNSGPDVSLYAPAQRPPKRRRSHGSDVASGTPPPKKLAVTVPVVPSDVASLVPFYASEQDVPAHLQKYWSQRERLFSRFAEGCLLDEEGWYSVTPERVAQQIAARCACNVVVDAFCGVGGNSIAFAQTCEQVIAIDNSPTRLALARHNARLYGVADRIEFILGDFLSFARSSCSRKRGIDVVFMSPPWGGPSYISSPAKLAQLDAVEHPEYSLSSILPVSGAELFAVARSITPHIAFYLPRNTRIDEISTLVAGEPPGQNTVEIEEEWTGNKLKALTCYFGGLAAGQEALWP